MNMLKQLNSAVEYIECNLCSEIDFAYVAKIAGISKDGLIRFFSYISGMTLKEYIRRRRLTLASDDLKQGDFKIIDVALKYGYESADAFSRAFTKQHGVTPSHYKKHGGSLKIYPPATFDIIVKGAKEMDFSLIELEDTLIYGVSKQYEGQGYKTREELRHSMWDSDCDDIPGMLCEGSWNQEGNISYDGVWYGIWQDGKYMIARKSNDTKNHVLEKRIIPAGTYATFKTECGGLAWEEFPKLFELVFDCWLPTSAYKQKNDLAIEVLHLWTDHDLRQKNRYYEVWVPIVEV